MCLDTVPGACNPSLLCDASTCSCKDDVNMLLHRLYVPQSCSYLADFPLCSTLQRPGVRRWGEHHFGNGWVQKYGNSSTGEHWDVSEQMDTYYNPIPHVGYQIALDHSPQLKAVPTLPRDGATLGPGIEDF